MQITEVQIIAIKPVDGLVAFASCVIDDQIYIGSIGVHKKRDGSGYRLTYPSKKIGLREINYFHPISRVAGEIIEAAIKAKCSEVLEESDGLNGRHSKDSHTS